MDTNHSPAIQWNTIPSSLAFSRMTSVEYIRHNDIILAIFLRSEHQGSGISFFTPDTFSQQLGYMSHPSGHVIQPHIHNPVPRRVDYTKEVLFIKSGKVRVDFYSEQQDYLKSSIINPGDFLLLAHGGHGFEILEPSEIIEIKQGPYSGETDKTRFSPVPSSSILF